MAEHRAGLVAGEWRFLKGGNKFANLSFGLGRTEGGVAPVAKSVVFMRVT